jgi:selenocysteine lyase/cysteine desulfurase
VSWDAFRAEMPVTLRWAYFDHAAVAPLTARAQRALAEYAADLTDHGRVNEPRWNRRIEEVRGLAARLVNAEPQDVAFIKNTSEGLGLVAEGFPWQVGDNVVSAAEEYPANVYPWLNLASRGVELRRVPSRGNRIELADIAKACDARTRLLTISSVEFASGFRNDLEALGELCQRRDIALCVDAIQSLGVFPLDVRALPIAFVAADGHKWLLGPEGAGIFFVRRDWLERLRPVGVGWNSVVGARDFSRVDFTLKPNAGRYESGSANVAGIHALGASLELLLEMGLANIAARVLELTDHLCAAASHLGLDVFSSRAGNDRSGIVSLSWSGDVRAAVRRCRERGIVINQRAGRLRFSPHAYNTETEIERVLAELLRVAKAGTRPEN